MKRILFTCTSLCALMLALSVMAMAQKSANFAGTWELDKSKSKMDERMAARINSITLTVTQDDKEIKVERKQDMAPPPGGGAGGGGAGGGGGTGGSEPLCDYDAPNTCTAATEIEAIDGDTGSDVRTLNGITSKWFKLRINEGSNLINDLSYVVTLKSPPGMDFDLYEYVGDGAATNCLGSAIHAMGDPESVSDAWSDSIGTDNGRWISLEVRYISGSACGADAKWTLTAEGHK